MICKAKNLWRKNLIFKLFLTTLLIISFWILPAQAKEPSYLTFTSVDRNTFNEYWYKITRLFFILQERFNVDNRIDEGIAKEILRMAKSGYNYLPDNLENENYLYKVSTAVQRWIKNPNNEANYTDLGKAIWDYLNKTDIKSIEWEIKVLPQEWNAPLTATLKWSVKDPSWSNLSDYNYTWWLDRWWKRVIIWQKPTIKYTFTKEWNITIFLEVKSNHKNAKWFTDVLPFKWSAVVNVKSKIASLVLNVNWRSLKNQDVLKVSPLEASYWLVFDATSSTPTEWTIFEKTTWDFWNGVKKSYKWWPKIERVTYSNQGDFDVLLQLKTSLWETVEKRFQIFIHKPIAKIFSSLDRWYLWDKFSFSAEAASKDKNLTYSWEIIDIDNDKVIYKKNWKLFNYAFTKKWKFNIKLKIKSASWDTDIDNKVIYIESKPPVANFKTSIPEENKPNTIFIDWSKSFDPDFSDDWKLKYYWIINWQRVKLNNANSNWSTWYYTFDSTWEQSISLEVRDSDWISDIKKSTININSVLDVDFTPIPKVIKRWWFVKFLAKSPDAEILEWDFWDGEKEWWSKKSITHYYKKSGTFKVTLKVRDKKDNANKITKIIYVSQSEEPFAIINIDAKSNSWWWTSAETTTILKNQCEWKPAYIIDRTISLTLKWWESLNIDWEKSWLDYTWKVWNSKILSGKDVNYKFDEIWCHKVKLTVTNPLKGKSNSTEVWLKVVNLKPELKSINLNIKDINADPIVVTTTAIWAKDRDWIIQSYLWYYYTDTDNEPQWFRATRTNSTTFVLPKIAWNYYFVLIMKDNNGWKTESKKWENSITLSWDNINTPLINLSVNDSSIFAWQEIVFTTKVENILWHDLSNKVTYSWDYDWDWFYDTETTKPIVAHTYKKSWEFFAKVKVKYKWFSNTKNITINVANQLVPDFKYISIWNKFIFFNNSKWTISNIIWDMWDWEKIRAKNNFVYRYKWQEKSHKVKLTISEWNKTKNKEKTVKKNIRNILDARKMWMNIFSIPKIGTWETITLKNQSEKLFLYLWESRWEYKYFPIDFDISYDTDLNWWKDDDEDNKWEDSYTSWAPLSIPLNKKREQIARITLLDSELKPLDSMDIKIIKEYIEKEEKTIDEWELSFSWVTDSEKETIEEIKHLITLLPEENKKEALTYISKLQEEWSDSTEKTRTILDFEEYLYNIESNNKDTIIELLESLLVEWQVEKSEKNITFNALKSLLPENISCNETWNSSSCYEYLLEKLEQINNSNDIEKNKILGKEILEVIARQDKSVINVKQWFDFKAILKSLIYGSTSEIPICKEWELNTELCRSLEEQPILNNKKDESDEKWSSLLKTVIKWIVFLIILWWMLMFIYFIYYKLTNKNSDTWFEDFIIEKTNPDDKENEDVLWFNVNKKQEDKWKINDVLADSPWKKEDKEESKEENKEKNVEAFADIFRSRLKKENNEVKKENDKNEGKEDNIPSWLNSDIWNNEIKKEENKESIFSLRNEEKIKKELKDEEKAEDNITTNKEPVIKEKEENYEDVFADIEEDDTPDWLKWSFTNEVSENKDSKKEKDDIPEWLSNSSQETSEKENKEKVSEEETSEDLISEETSEEETNKNLTSEETSEENKSNKVEEPINIAGQDKEDINEKEVYKETNEEEEKKEKTQEKKKKKELTSKKSIEKNKNEKIEEKKKVPQEKKTKTWKSINWKSVDMPNWLKSEEKVNSDIKLKESKSEDNNKEKGEKDNKKTRSKKNIKSKTLEIDLSQESSNESEEKKESKNKPQKEREEKFPKEKKIDEKINNDMELWDDWMKVPDWLKTDDNK